MDFDVDVADDDVIRQVEGVAVGGMGFVPLCWRVRSGREITRTSVRLGC